MTEKVLYCEAATALNEQNSKDEDVMEGIIRHVGEMGTYQRWLILSMLPFGAAMAFVYAIPMFIAATPQEHWCRVPELQNLTVDLRRNLSIPGAVTGDWDRCRMYDANWTEVLQTLKPPLNGTATVPCRNGWEFLFNDIPFETVISERGWVCDRAGYAPFAQSLFFVGSLVGCILFGWIGDAYGRLPSFIGANIAGFLGGVATMFTTGVWDFAVCRFLTGLSYDSSYGMIYIIILEYVGTRHRTWVTNLSMGLYCGGAMILSPLLALWLKDWRQLMLVTSTPMLLALVTPFLVPESARWLASTGKVKKAITVLKRFEKINNRKIPEDVLNDFVMLSNQKWVSDESLKALFQSAPLRNSLLVLILVSTVSSIGIDAIIRLSENIGDDFFITFVVSSIAEIPALVVVTFTLDRFGRRPVITATMTLTGIFSFICAFLSRGLAQMFMAVMSRFFVNMALSALLQMGPELLPTPVRATGNSLIHLTVFVGTILSPYVVFSGRAWEPLPLLIVSAISVLAGFVALLLPETKGRAMPQTIAAGEKLVKENMLCGKVEDEDSENMKELPPLKPKT